MEAPVTSRSMRIMHRMFAREAVATTPNPAPDAAQPLGTWAVQSLWLGLASGWLELGVILGHRALVGTVTTESVRLNQYHILLGFLAHLAIFAVGFGMAAALANRWTRRWWRDPVVTFLGWFLAFASPLLALEELHWASSLIVAAAVASRVAPWWARRRGTILRRTLVPLAAASVLIGGGSFATIRSSEDRALAALPAPTRPDAPNVVLLVLDTARASNFSLYGYHRPTTPNLDALAGRATTFSFARSAAPWTLPSHATMFTGRWPHELSADYDMPLDGTHPTLAEYLGRHGYATGGFVGNTIYCNSWFGLDRGFARYEDENENRAITAQETLRSAAMTREMMPLAVQLGVWPSDGQHAPRKTAEEINRAALSWLDRREGGDRPFFLFLNYIDVHGPYTIPDDFPRQFSRATRLEIIEANKRARRRSIPIEERHKELDRLGIDAYDDCIRYVDAQIARLLEELERRGKRKNTWVIVTADHGEHFGEHGLYNHGNSLFRPLVDVPLVVIPPEGVAAGQRVSDPVSLRDLPATVADLVGLAPGAPFPGRSLRHHWDDSLGSPGQPGDAPVSELKLPSTTENLSSLPVDDRVSTAVVDRGRIYHRNPLGSESLYDVDDPKEAVDLAPRPDEAPALEHFRALGEGMRRGKP